ncbi:OmpA family protein [Marinilabilia salmonicolor]|jgi:outer membrane protein OmpA-like peptidoglycan-associated protein/HEPN domain-containing protein|uniref:Outer membrane protein OmpA-like peptidoglycan-associated protein n=1 Tax=Marinilabilia salmonicolor TaxID=989 RepID=A0A368UKK6_9BACT|nr:OmpA family protein [Marinilabilia salmonicolor]RCW29223.1 outer membrane protein OmpA-like peptidoglycan-associated protein [Marinilabilia salmonicolor]
MKTIERINSKVAILLCLSLMMISTLSYAQQTKSTLFKKADQAMLDAKFAQADLLVPDEYNKGIENYRQAEKHFADQKGVEKIEESLVEAVNHFNRAVTFSVSAKSVFASSLDARSDALLAGADRSALETWKEAEEVFNKATRELEKGDRDDSYKYATEAIELYRKAELTSIKTDLLDKTRALLTKADDTNVDRNAPKTLKKAESLLAATERELETNRYDMDYPRTLAKQAKYEASHAIELDKTISKMDDRDMEMEDVILQYELPLIRIAEKAGFVAQFQNGIENPEQGIIKHISELQIDNNRLNAENIARDNEIRDLKTTIDLLKNENLLLRTEFDNEVKERSDSMKSKMLEFETEKARLDAKIEKQTKLNQQFEEVYLIFDKSEASVFRSGDEIVIRLHGFGFATGKSEITPTNFDLLTKVQNAIKIFPESSVIVEGYTDSFGGDASNLMLSQKRSDAVTQYLNANSDTEEDSRISSVGYGEINPVANNETAEGRKQNRRIDVKIQPQM